MLFRSVNSDDACDVCGCEMFLDAIQDDDSGAKIEISEAGGALLPVGTVFHVDVLALAEVTETELGKIEKSTGGKTQVLAVYDLSLTCDNVSIQANGKLLVTLPAVEGDYDSIKVVYLADDGSAQVCKTTVNADGTISFETDHFSRYVIVGVQEGLPTIAVVGIVFGTIAVVTIGGFLLFAFVIKKKE